MNSSTCETYNTVAAGETLGNHATRLIVLNMNWIKTVQCIRGFPISRLELWTARNAYWISQSTVGCDSIHLFSFIFQQVHIDEDEAKKALKEPGMFSFIPVRVWESVFLPRMTIGSLNKRLHFPAQMRFGFKLCFCAWQVSFQDVNVFG